MAISYPSTPNFYDPEAVMQQTARGFQSGKDWRDNKNAESAFGKYLEGLYGPGQQQPQQGAPQSLSALAPQFGASAPVGAVQRVPLGTPDPATARVDQAFAAQGQTSANSLDGNQIAGRFLKTVKDGGLTNPFGLAAVASTGKHESGFDPKNAVGTWSDPSQSGQAGMAGGIMSWRGDRLAKLQAFAQQNGDNPNAPSPETQGKYLLAEDPALIAKLNAAQSPQEAQQIMNNAWKFAGYDQPGGEAGQRIADAQAYAPQFGGGNAQAPSQQALEGLAVGQSAPMGQGAPQQAYGGPAGGSMAQGSAPQGGMQPQQAASILPPREVMADLFKSPGTRPLAIELVKAAQGLSIDQNDPMKQLQYKKAVLELQQLQQNGGQPIPQGYRATANGLEAIPGGPSDPSNPLNIRRTTAAGGSSGETDGNAAAIASAIIKGDQPPTMTGLYKYSGPVRAALAKQGYDLSTANEDWTATQKHLASLNGPQQLRLRQAVDFAASSTDLVDELATQWKGGQYPLLNAANLKLAKSGAYGQEAASLATRLSASIADLTSELGTVYKGGNGSTDETLRLASQNLNESWSTDTIKDATDQIRKTLVYRQNSLKHVGVSGIDNSQYDPRAKDGGAPEVGTVQDGYSFKGGDPSDQNNWEPAP